MKLPTPEATLVTSLSPEHRLALLQTNDPLRAWKSVNDVRTCICCSRKLTGLRLQVWEQDGRYLFRCPTPSCAGSLADFVMPGDPFSDDAVWADWMRTLDQPELSHAAAS